MNELLARVHAAEEAGGRSGTAVDALLSSAASAQGRTTVFLPLDQLDPWSDAEHPEQPFHLYSEEEMRGMMESMAKKQYYPIIVRPRNGRYQILAGHNRTIAAQRLGLDMIEAFVERLDDDAAALAMVDTNFKQRPILLPSELAWGYKIKLEALKHQGQHTSSQVETKRSDEAVGEKDGISRTKVQRYIKLTKLSRELLDIVDGYQYEGEQWVRITSKPTISLTAAELLTKLTPCEQSYIAALFRSREINGISRAQAAELETARSGYGGGDMPPAFIRRCLGLQEDDEMVDHREEKKTEKPLAIKLSPGLLGINENAKRYLKEVELQQRIARVINGYVLERSKR